MSASTVPASEQNICAPKIRLEPEGDSMLMVRFPNVSRTEVSGLITAAAYALNEAPLPSRIETVPAYATLAVYYDPLEASFDEMQAAIADVLSGLEPLDDASETVIDVPVCYGGEFGPDLGTVACHAGISEDEVVRLHTARTYRVDILGFMPGFAYLSGLDERLITPRLDVPRTLVPAGSVGIGGEQTGMYSIASPGGWQIIGRTPARLYDPVAVEPVRLHAGDRVRFVPIGRDAFEQLEKQACRDEGGPQEAKDSPAGITVMHAGICDTVQDLGRFGHQAQGFAPAGPMDRRSAALANILVGNDATSALLEVVACGPTLHFDRAAVICFTGGDFDVTLDGCVLEPYQAHEIPAGSELRIGAALWGQYGYLAVAGGLAVPPALRSRSMALGYPLGASIGRPLRAGDSLPIPDDAPMALPDGCMPYIASHDAYFRRDHSASETSPVTIRVITATDGGAAAQWMSEACRTTFVIDTRSNRMGIRLRYAEDDARYAPRTADLLSEAVALGTIQIPASGEPIIAMADRQTTGGYVKAATVITVDLARLAQCQPGTPLRFEPVDLAFAQRAVRSEARYLRGLRKSMLPCQT